MNTAFSNAVRSAQGDVHPRLESIVRRHLDRPWLGGSHAPTVAAFRAVEAVVRERDRPPLILDSGCGTGQSTRSIAAANRGSLVIGIDQSAARLERLHAPGLPHVEGNALWVRAELAAFWRLAWRAGWRLERHFLLYPNPWPKAAHIRRRWHGHPVFPAMLALGGRLEMRTNWRIFALEFARAAQIVTGIDAQVGPVEASPVTSPFECKYRKRGDALYRVRLSLPSAG